MNGGQLYDRIMALRAELEKYPKLALAQVLAVETLSRAAYFTGGLDVDESCERARKDLKEELRKTSDIARSIYKTRRFEALMRQIEDGSFGKKKRRKRRGRRARA